MAKLKIKNVGPIRNGATENEGFINFRGVTIFTGNQGTGKSTIAKIYSTLSWIEKALVRGDFTASHLTQYNRFKKQLAYQNIGNYLHNESEIEYEGNAYKISYTKGNVIIAEQPQNPDYEFPKIMYVPAERNFVSSVDRPDLVKRLPLPLYTFLEEYDEAKQNFGEGVNLPLGRTRFEYRKQNKKSWLVGPDYRIDLLEASSGFQSVVPLILVTKYLNRVIGNEANYNRKEISIAEEKRIRKEIDNIFSNVNISEDVRRVLLERLSSRFKYSCFVNIVEEPEQNLYPISQRDILFELLKAKNESISNELVITTHSPYIINYLTLAIKAYIIKETSDRVTQGKINQIVPLDAAVNPNLVDIYQINDTGEIISLPRYKGLPSDENKLNSFLAEFNDMFESLMNLS